ncbi:hypothetical protein D3C72_1527360 [compost metagenome]
MAVGQHQVPTLKPDLRGVLRDACIGCAQVSAAGKPHRPRLRTFRQHGRHGPHLALGPVDPRAQIHVLHPGLQNHVSARRDQRAARQGDRGGQVRVGGQGNAGRPGDGAKEGAT